MKKFFLLLAAIVGLSVSANADDHAQCKIAGANNATYSASIDSYDHETGKVTVSAQNDSQEVVTGVVSVTWAGETKTTTIIVQRENSSVPKVLTFSKGKSMSHTPSIRVSSAKCQK